MSLLPPLCPQSSRHSKLEKADILEMTVKHLRSLQRAQMTGEWPGGRVDPSPPPPGVTSSRLPPVVLNAVQAAFH